MEINVETQTGSFVTLKADHNTTVFGVKWMLLRTEFIPPTQQRLTFRGSHSLDDRRTLGYYHIPRGSTLYMALRNAASSSRVRTVPITIEWDEACVDS